MAKKSAIDKAIDALEQDLTAAKAEHDKAVAEYNARFDAICGAIDALRKQKPLRVVTETAAR